MAIHWNISRYCEEGVKWGIIRQTEQFPEIARVFVYMVFCLVCDKVDESTAEASGTCRCDTQGGFTTRLSSL